MASRWWVTPGRWHSVLTGPGVMLAASATPLLRVCPVPLMWSGLLDLHW